MTMFAVFILALRIIFVPFASTDSDVPCAICSFFGVENEITHPLPVGDIPKGCNAVNFGAYYFNETQSQENIDAIACLVSANHEVFIGMAAEKFWTDVLTTDTYDSEIENMANYLTENKICGIFLEINSDVYDLGITDCADKVNTLVCKIKATAPTVKVGLSLNGVQSYMFVNESLFSFTTTNCAIDMYQINTGSSGLPCWEDVAIQDTFPIDLEGSKYISLDNICQDIAASCMDKSKVFIGLSISVAVGLVKEQALGMALEYPQFCCLSQTDMEKDTIYCPDSLDLYQKRASYIKPYAAGIFIFNLDYDYWNDDCGCERYAITNTMIDGFGCN